MPEPTKEKPIEEGYYWCKDFDDKWVIEEFVFSDGSLGFEDNEHRYGGGWIEIDSCWNQWAGPLTEPPKKK